MNILKHYFSSVNENADILLKINEINRLELQFKQNNRKVVLKRLKEIFACEEGYQLKEDHIEMLLNAENDENSDIRGILNMVADDEKRNNLIKTKLKFVPKDLHEEVLLKIDRQFKKDADAYIKSVDLYFDKFTLENLSKCNIKDSETYEIASINGKRKLNRERKINIWHASVLLKLVGKKSAKYACNSIRSEFKQAKRKEKEFVNSCKLVGKNRKVFELKNCIKTSEQAVAEKLNLLSVQEKIASDKDWTWAFITLTLDGQFHPNPKKGKFSYNGVSPNESAKLINNKIKRVRALMHKWDIKAGRDYMGCSSAEAHEDGCLHKHLLIFCSAEKLEEIRRCFEFHFKNLNNKSFRVESEENKNKPFKKDGEEYVKGKFRERAASYVFKYVMKSITSYDLDTDFKDMKKADKNAVLNNAFRSYNMIRGFSFFGIENCLTKFRFIARNLKDMKLPVEIESLVEKNDLYQLLSKGFFSMFENVYVQEENSDSRIFVGCKFNGRMYFKRFFQLVRNASSKLVRTEIAINFLMMKKREIEVLSLLGVVIVNHNYSREMQNTAQSALSPPI